MDCASINWLCLPTCGAAVAPVSAGPVSRLLDWSHYQLALSPTLYSIEWRQPPVSASSVSQVLGWHLYLLVLSSTLLKGLISVGLVSYQVGLEPVSASPVREFMGLRQYQQVLPPTSWGVANISWSCLLPLGCHYYQLVLSPTLWGGANIKWFSLLTCEIISMYQHQVLPQSKNLHEGPLSVSSALSFIGGVHIGAKALHVLNLIRLGYITRRGRRGVVSSFK